MGFFDELNAQASGQPSSTKGGSFWDQLNASSEPTKLEKYQAEAKASEAEAKRANSIGTLTKETVKGVLSSIPKAFSAGVDQVKQGYGQLTGSGQSLTQRGEGLLNVGAGIVNAAGAPLAPITEPIGKAVQYGGDQLAKTPLIKQWGEANPQNGVLTPLERGLGAVVNATTIAGAAAPFLKKPTVPTRTLGVTSATPEAATIPVKKTVPVLSRQTEPTRVNIQTPYLTPDQMPTIQMGNKADRPMSNLPVVDYNSPVLPKPKSKDAILQPVEELKMRVDFAKEALDQNPAKDLVKYVSRTTGSLPEVTGKGKANTFGRKGDDIVKSAGFEDVNQAQAALEQYQADKARINDMKQQVKTAAATAKAELKLQPKTAPEKPLRYVPVNEPKRAPVLAKPKQAATPIQTKPATPSQKTGRVTKVARDLNEKLVKQGYDELPPEVQSKYTPESYKEIAKTVVNDMSNNLDDTIKMAKGELPLNKKLHGHGQVLFNAVAKHAEKTGDYELMRDLAKSPLGKERSLAAQRLGESGFNANPDSAVSIMESINSTREKAVSRRVDVKKATDELRKVIKEKVLTKEEVHKFIDSITC